MELKEYISQTIYEIAQGVIEASQKCAELGAIVNPAETVGENGSYYVPKDKIKGHTAVERRVQQIHMDVLISVTESSMLDSTLKASIKVLGADVNGKTEGNTVNSNRVSFDIPVCLPVPDAK